MKDEHDNLRKRMRRQSISAERNICQSISRATAEEALEPLTQQPMTPAEVNHARRQHNLPLDSEAETEQPVQPKFWMRRRSSNGYIKEKMDWKPMTRFRPNG